MLGNKKEPAEKACLPDSLVARVEAGFKVGDDMIDGLNAQPTLFNSLRRLAEKLAIQGCGHDLMDRMEKAM
jgi:hypothetical protein